MSQTELVFRGTNAEECRKFIREIHQRAHEVGRFRDSAWMADNAMSALDGDALKLFGELDQDVQGDWTLLRAELLRRYCSDESKLVPTAPKAGPPPKQAVPASAIDPLIKSVPSISDRMCVRIRVEAPGVGYVGYLSGFDYTEFGHACILNRDPSKAFPVSPTDGGIFNLEIIEEKSGRRRVSKVAPFRASTSESQRESDGAVLARWSGITDRGGKLKYYSPTADGEKVGVSEQDWMVDPSLFGWQTTKKGKLQPLMSNGYCWTVTESSMKTILSKTSKGGLTILFWKPRPWEKEDDPCLAHLYLERFNG